MTNDLNSFFDQVRKTSGLSFGQIANLVKLNERTIRDWRRGKYNPSHKTLYFLSTKFEVDFPRVEKKLADNWGAKLGGVASQQKHGSYFESLSEDQKRLNIKKAALTRKRRGYTDFVQKEIKYPKESYKLAEFVGIVLGDGAVTPGQVVITLHRIDDGLYADYVCRLIYDLFDVRPSKHPRDNVINIRISRVLLVGFLNRMGINVGNKVRQQVDVPTWIKSNISYSKACLRGLFDTDGCFYVDKHLYKNKVYENCAINFSNRSKPLLDFFQSQLSNLNFHPLRTSGYNVCLKRELEVIKYSEIIGFSNSKHKHKAVDYCLQKYGEVPKWL